jgi:multiple antibiotic resistance protein
MNQFQIVEAVRTIVLAFTALFPLVNPVGGAPIFLSLTRRYPQSAQKVLARKIAIYGFALLAGSLILGTEVLSFFGISLTVVQIAGGLVVPITAWNLLNQSPAVAASSDPGTLEDALQHAFFPLTLPITVGPGCISVAITLGAHLRYQNAAEHGFSFQFFGSALIGMALVCLLVVICYGNADRLVKLLGASGTSILTRLSAFILLALGVQIIWNGLESGLPQVFVKGTH